MRETIRWSAGGVLLLLLGCALAACLSVGTLPTADFTLANGSEPQTLDPHLANGQPEGRLAYALFEGLYRKMPLGVEFDRRGELVRQPQVDPQGNTPLGPAPAMALRHELSEDRRTYTFYLREDASWSDGEPITAHDFVWSWRRLLHPETASQYASHLYHVTGARDFNQARIRVGQTVELELRNRPKPEQMYPHGTMKRFELAGIELHRGESVEVREELDANLELGPEDYVVYQLNTGSQIEEVKRGPGRPFDSVTVLWVLPDFESEVGIRAIDDFTLEVVLAQPTSFFSELVAFYSLCPVPRHCIETHGDTDWTKPGNMVSNGPFVLELRRIRDRIRLRKNDQYWNHKVVRLNRVDFLSVDKETTALNAYLNGQIDWCTLIPTALVPQLATRDDFQVAPQMTTYFYRFNTTKAPFDDARVRKALSLVIDRKQICDKITGAGERPSEVLCPPGMRGYLRPSPRPPAGGLVNLKVDDLSEDLKDMLNAAFEEGAIGLDWPLTTKSQRELKRQVARKWLQDAGYGQGGKPFPRIELLYNTADNHRAIAEYVQQTWRNQLDVDVELVNAEWGTYLSRMKQMDFDIVRGGWIGDYQDPQTFLELWTTGNENNHTGWSDSEYDAMVIDSVNLPEAQRMRELARAEALVVEHLPFLPIYNYVSRNLVDKRFVGWYPNCEDVHPIHLVRRRPLQ